MNAYAFPPLLAALLNSVIIFWVLSYGRKDLVQRTFALWNLSIGFWNLSIALGYLSGNAEQALAWYKATTPPAIAFIAPLFLHFSMAFTGHTTGRHRWLIALAYLSGLPTLYLGMCTPAMLRDVFPYFWGYYPLEGRLEWWHGVNFAWMSVYAFSLLIRGFLKSEGIERHHYRCLIIGAAIGFVSGFTNFLPLRGIEVYPVGNLVNSVYSLVIAYAILEYGLFDIRLALRRGTVYAMLAGSLTAVYLTLVTVMQRLFGHYGVQEQVVFYMAAFPMTVVLAPAMKTRIEPFVNSAFPAIDPSTRSSDFSKPDMVLMGVLATEMAHELTKPLTHIMNAGTKLEDSLKGKSREDILTIEREVKRAAEILDGFAMLSPERALHRIAVPFGSLIDESLEALGVQEDKSFVIERRFEPMSSVYVNPGQIVQVLTNLIQNAWQAMPDGGHVVLGLRALAGKAGKRLLEFSITDTGPGIPPALHRRIFDPFFTTKETRGGRGMGLTISRAMVERHGGTISVHSPVKGGRGTRFVVHLPMKIMEASHEKRRR